MGKIRTSGFGFKLEIWLKCLLAKVLRKCLATMTYDTILYGGYLEPYQVPTKGASFQRVNSLRPATSFAKNTI